jgi:hypothetical protein
MECRLLSLVLAGSVLFQLGCGGGDGGGGGIPTCSAFTACGGDLKGKWAVDGICMEGDLEAAMAGMEELPAECGDMYKDISMKMSGTVEFANGTQTSDVTMETKLKFTYTSACLSAMSGTSMTMTQALCDKAASSYDDGEGPTVACSFTGGACACTMSMNKHEQSATGYTVSGNTFTTEDGDDVEYCVSGTTLTVRDQSSDGQGSQTKLHKL